MTASGGPGARPGACPGARLAGGLERRSQGQIQRAHICRFPSGKPPGPARVASCSGICAGLMFPRQAFIGRPPHPRTVLVDFQQPHAAVRSGAQAAASATTALGRRQPSIASRTAALDAVNGPATLRDRDGVRVAQHVPDCVPGCVPVSSRPLVRRLRETRDVERAAATERRQQWPLCLLRKSARCCASAFPRTNGMRLQAWRPGPHPKPGSSSRSLPGHCAA